MTKHFSPTQHSALSILGVGQDENMRGVQVDRMIPGASQVMRSMKRLIVTMAPAEAPVLITGPSGAGKELVAQALHDLSDRSGPFIAVNCAAIPVDLLEGELFGSERGAYTGADRARAGLIEQAEGGTLFLDEIGDLPHALQAKLLRVLETRTVRRLGGGAPVQLDFRLVAATHQDLAAMTLGNRFREDLYYRLSVFPVTVPSLSERVCDLPLILGRLLDDCATAQPSTPLPQFDASALRALSLHPWKGNIRELKTVVLRACLLFPGRAVTAREVRDNLLSFASPAPDADAGAWPEAQLPSEIGLPSPDRFSEALTQFKSDIDLRGYLRDIEIAFITAALERNGNCVSRTADTLRLRRTTLIEKLRKYGIASQR